jgi:hypothetical protein
VKVYLAMVRGLFGYFHGLIREATEAHDMRVFLALAGDSDWSNRRLTGDIRQASEEYAMKVFLAAAAEKTSSYDHLNEAAAEHDMKVYLAQGANLAGAGEVQAQVAEVVRHGRVLCSFHYYGDEGALELVRERLPHHEIFVDSGAFSAFSLGAKVDPNEYIEWAYKHRAEVSRIASPDVIGDPAAGFAATETMLARFAGDGPPVLPVFHVGSDWAWLDRCCKQSDHIALGGMVPFASRATTELGDWIRACFKRIPDHVQVHGFGMTNWGLMKAYPWASVDSSTWNGATRFRKISLFDETSGTWPVFETTKREHVLRVTGLLRSYGIDPADVLATRRSKEVGSALLRASIESWLRAERWLTDKRAKGTP